MDTLRTGRTTNCPLRVLCLPRPPCRTLPHPFCQPLCTGRELRGATTAMATETKMLALPLASTRLPPLRLRVKLRMERAAVTRVGCDTGSGLRAARRIGAPICPRGKRSRPPPGPQRRG